MSCTGDTDRAARATADAMQNLVLKGETKKSPATTPAATPRSDARRTGVFAGSDTLKTEAIKGLCSLEDQALLVESAKKGDEMKVMELLKKGTDVEWTDAKGQTALMHACDAGHDGVVNVLLGTMGKANVDTVNPKNGRTALHYAVGKARFSTTQILIEEWEAKIETVDNVYGYTPLLLACFTNDKRMVLYLLSKGADIKAKDRDTGTCMHIAAEGGYVEVVKALTTCDKVELGATTKTGKTPADVARTDEIRELLLRKQKSLKFKITRVSEKGHGGEEEEEEEEEDDYGF